MSDADATPEAMLRTHEFAAKALEELTARAEADGQDPVALHLAYCVASVGYLSNAIGLARTRQFLRQLERQLEAAPPQG